MEMDPSTRDLHRGRKNRPTTHTFGKMRMPTKSKRRKLFLIGSAVVLAGAVLFGIVTLVQNLRDQAQENRILRDPYSDHPIKAEILGPS